MHSSFWSIVSFSNMDKTFTTKSAISSSLRPDRFIFKMLQVDPAAYQLLLDCIESNDINVCDQVPLGVESGGRKLVNPLGGGGHQVDGADRCVHPSALMHGWAFSEDVSFPASCQRSTPERYFPSRCSWDGLHHPVVYLPNVSLNDILWPFARSLDSGPGSPLRSSNNSATTSSSKCPTISFRKGW